jgi:arginine N-succinyltransferase
MVDIFDAGACVSCPRDEIRTVRESRTAVVDQISDSAIDSPTQMIGSFAPTFRATIGPLEILATDRVAIDSKVAEALKISVGSTIRFASLRPAPASQPTIKKNPNDAD